MLRGGRSLRNYVALVSLRLVERRRPSWKRAKLLRGWTTLMTKPETEILGLFASDKDAARFPTTLYRVKRGGRKSFGGNCLEFSIERKNGSRKKTQRRQRGGIFFENLLCHFSVPELKCSLRGKSWMPV